MKFKFKVVNYFIRKETPLGSENQEQRFKIITLRAQLEPDGWIEVEETPPGDIGLWVWLFPHEDGVVLAQYIGEGFYRVDRRSIYGTYFTHWMPAHLPEPPREG